MVSHTDSLVIFIPQQWSSCFASSAGSTCLKICFHLLDPPPTLGSLATKKLMFWPKGPSSYPQPIIILYPFRATSPLLTTSSMPPGSLVGASVLRKAIVGSVETFPWSMVFLFPAVSPLRSFLILSPYWSYSSYSRSFDGSWSYPCLRSLSGLPFGFPCLGWMPFERVERVILLSPSLKMSLRFF